MTLYPIATYPHGELVSIARAVLILRDEVRATTDVLTALSRLERCLPPLGTPEARAVWADAHYATRESGAAPTPAR